MTIDFYGTKYSVPSRAAQMVARHLNIDINFKEVDLATKQQLNPDFLQLNLVHTVPTINDNGFVLWESRAIMQYLCNQYAPDSQLYPKDPKQRALVDRFLNFDISYSLSQKSVLGVKVFAGVDPPADKVIAYENNLKLVDTLIGDNPYVTGDVLTIADLSLLASATFIEMADYHINGYPNYKRWYSSLKARLPYFHEINSVSRSELDAFVKKRKANK